MEKRALIVQNSSREGAGNFEACLQEAGIAWDIVNVGAKEPWPDFSNYGWMFVMGGPQSANDTSAEMLEEIEKVREWIQSGKPYLGICLGLQVGVKAMGGEVVPSPVKEIGFQDKEGRFYEVRLAKEAQSDALLQGTPERWHVFQLHGETVRCAEGMQVLGEGQVCPVQIVKIRKKAYGFQGHVELTREMLLMWHKEDPDLQPLDLDFLLEGWNKTGVQMQEIAFQVGRNFLRLGMETKSKISCMRP